MFKFKKRNEKEQLIFNVNKISERLDKVLNTFDEKRNESERKKV